MTEIASQFGISPYLFAQYSSIQQRNDRAVEQLGTGKKSVIERSATLATESILSVEAKKLLQYKDKAVLARRQVLAASDGLQSVQEALQDLRDAIAKSKSGKSSDISHAHEAIRTIGADIVQTVKSTSLGYVSLLNNQDPNDNSPKLVIRFSRESTLEISAIHALTPGANAESLFDENVFDANGFIFEDFINAQDGDPLDPLNGSLSDAQNNASAVDSILDHIDKAINRASAYAQRFQHQANIITQRISFSEDYSQQTQKGLQFIQGTDETAITLELLHNRKLISGLDQIFALAERQQQQLVDWLKQI